MPPALDESWWAALLSEEDRNHSTAVSEPVKSEPPAANKAPNPQVDWSRVEQIYSQDQTVCLRVTGYNRGGLLVAGNMLQGFVPISHLVEVTFELPEAERNVLLAKYVDTTLCLKVIECDSERGRVVLSQRAALAGAGQRNFLFETLEVGEHVWGTVTNVTDFGVFVDLGGLEGLVHVSELSWGRVRHPIDVTSAGSRIETIVLCVDRERGRVALSLKRLHSNPWETAPDRYTPGQIIEAKITSIVSFGAFARLEEGLDGLIHISALARDGQLVSPWDVLSEGQQVRVRVLHVDAGKQRLGLSLCSE